jgi:hypothetical protein
MNENFVTPALAPSAGNRVLGERMGVTMLSAVAAACAGAFAGMSVARQHPTRRYRFRGEMSIILEFREGRVSIRIETNGVTLHVAQAGPLTEPRSSHTIGAAAAAFRSRSRRAT